MSTTCFTIACYAFKAALLGVALLAAACVVGPRATSGIHLLTEDGVRTVLRTNALPPLAYWDYGELQTRTGVPVRIYEYAAPDGFVYTFLCRDTSIWELIITKQTR